MPNSDTNLLGGFVEQFQPPAIRVGVDLLALDRIYEQLPARFPRLYEQLLLTFMWDDVELIPTRKPW